MTVDPATLRSGSQIISDHCPLWHLTELPSIDPPTIKQVREEAWALIGDLARELDRATGETETSPIL